MTWYILRHAEKERGDFYNKQLRLQDHPLSNVGKQSAANLVDLFIDKPIAAIYISSYLRTKQTITAVAKHLQLDPVVDSRLNEIDNGAVGDKSENEFQRAFPEEWRTFAARKADFCFPDGETGAEVQMRIREFFDEKLSQHSTEDIILVSHDGWIRIMMCTLLGLPVYRRGEFRTDYCGLTELCYQSIYATWQIVRFNQHS